MNKLLSLFPLAYFLTSCATYFSAEVEIEALEDLGQTVIFQDGQRFVNSHRNDIGLASSLTVEEFVSGKPSHVKLQLGFGRPS